MNFDEPQIAVDPDGVVALVWREGDATIRGAVAPAGGSFGAPLSLLRAPALTDLARDDPSLSVTNTGTFTAAWEQGDGTHVRERTRSFGAEGAAPTRTVARRRAYARGPASGCRPRGSRSLIEARDIRVFRDRVAPATYDLQACLKSRRVPVEIVSTFGRATLTLAAPLVGYATVDCDAVACDTRLQVVDLRDPTSVRSDRLARNKTVTQLRLIRSGRIAWIECDTNNGNLDSPCAPRQTTEVWIGDVYRRS